MDFNGEDSLHIEELSANDSDDNEERHQEIKKLLADELNNETFDYDEDEEGENNNNINKSNNNSLIFPPPLPPINTTTTSNTNGIRKNSNVSNYSNSNGHGLDFDLRKNNNHNGTNGNGINGNGTSSRENFINFNQKDSERNEIEEKNPTISLLHRKHCPQNGEDGLDSQIWLSSENNVEQLKTLCEFRERQIARSEETIERLTKEKRSLNHQIGLMKNEMLEFKNNYEELLKVSDHREEEVKYIRGRLREAIDEYEKVCQTQTDLHTKLAVKEYELEAFKKAMSQDTPLITLPKATQIVQTQTDAILPKNTRPTSTQTQSDVPRSQEKPFIAKTTQIVQTDTILTPKSTRPTQTDESMSKGQDRPLIAKPAKATQIVQIQTEEIEDEKESSSDEDAKNIKTFQTIQIQTDETLETYKALAGMLDGWAEELLETHKKAFHYQDLLKDEKEKYISLVEKYKNLEKVGVLSRKEWIAKEKTMDQKYTELKDRYINLITALSTKLNYKSDKSLNSQ